MNDLGQALEGIRSVEEFEVCDKVVFLRLDLNVPIDEEKILDDTRIKKSLKTIQYLLEKKARVVIASHLGDPGGVFCQALSLSKVARKINELLNVEVVLVDSPDMRPLKILIQSLRPDQVILLENLRFHPGEKSNDQKLAKIWKSYTDIYINDAFGVGHRCHASVDALPRMMKQKGYGFLMREEILAADRLTCAPKKPFVCVFGGAKITDKIGMIEKFIDLVDTVLIGGGMAYTFLAAKGQAVGKSLLDRTKIGFCSKLLERFEARDINVVLPIDFVVAPSKDKHLEAKMSDTIDQDMMGLDIGEKTRAQFASEISKAQTLFWNGPMGVFEIPEFSQGTRAVACAVAGSEAVSFVGGGDSASALSQMELESKITHVSTGGGATLAYLQGEEFVALKALKSFKVY